MCEKEHSHNGQKMKFSDFDAWVDSWPPQSPSAFKGFLVLKGQGTTVSVARYDKKGEGGHPDEYFVRVHTSRNLILSWDDAFEILDRKNGSVLFQGRVLLPVGGGVEHKMGRKRRLELLRGLSGEKKDMILAKTRLHGIKGVWEKELIDFSHLPRETLHNLSRHLEGTGKIRILSFSPLFLFSQESFDYLCERVLVYLSDFHEKYPEDFGVAPEKLQKRFGLPPRVLSLVLEHLRRTDQISQSEKIVALGDFRPLPSPEEESLLNEMEAMHLGGELRLVSQEELQKRFNLSRKRLNRMLSFLVERRKIVLGKEGFLLHSRWLDEIIRKIHRLEKNELSVSDFKQMTGLTRKYAIPLLELLDQLGITRRRGPTREIIRDAAKKGRR